MPTVMSGMMFSKMMHFKMTIALVMAMASTISVAAQLLLIRGSGGEGGGRER